MNRLVRVLRMFPNKLLSRLKQYAQSLEILSAVESIKIHVQFCCPSAVSFPIKEMVVLFFNDMIRCFVSLRRAVDDRVRKTRRQANASARLRNN